MKLTGGFVITPSGTGVGFQNLPDIPIGHFALTFNGGAGGLVATTADLCYTPSIFITSFDAWSGTNQSGNTTASVEGCGPPKPRKISGSLRKAHSPHPKLRLKITGGPELRSVKVKLPKSLKLERGTDGIEAESLSIKHGARKLAIKTASAIAQPAHRSGSADSEPARSASASSSRSPSPTPAAPARHARSGSAPGASAWGGRRAGPRRARRCARRRRPSRSGAGGRRPRRQPTA